MANRRDVLRLGGLAVAGAVAGAGAGSAKAAQAHAGTAAESVVGSLSSTQVTTLDRTVALGPDQGNGYRKLVAGPGESWTVRTELAPLGESIPPGSPARGPLIAFAQMSDMQICDDQSPARVEYLDRLDGEPIPSGSAYRAQESLSTQVTDAMARAIANVRSAPATGLPLSMTLVTGDAVDNCQLNEVRWYVDLLDGNKQIEPDSGGPGDQSVTGGLAGSNPDYWRPGTGYYLGQRYVQAGFPAVPGFEEAARRPYTSHGLGMPWYATLGNHDLLMQGNVPIALDITLPNGVTLSPRDMAVGTGKIIGYNHPLPTELDVSDLLETIFHNGPHTIHVAPDNRRKMLSGSQIIDQHYITDGLPVGHGFDSRSRGHYAFSTGPNDLFRFISLDTNATVGSDGYIDATQFAWLENQLKACHSKYELADGSPLSHPTLVTQPEVRDQLVVIFCHHNINSINSFLLDVPGDDGKSGQDLQDLLLRFPNVIMVVNGHSHRNKITAYSRRASARTSRFNGGFYQINTASSIDWPVQSRIIEVTESSPGHLSIYTTMIDIDAPLDYQNDLSTPATLAALARELAANEIEPHLDRSGQLADRNARLIVPVPFKLPVSTAKLAVAPHSDGRLHLFGATAADGLPFLRWQGWAGGEWSNWTQMDGYWLRAIAAETNADGRMELFGLNKYGHIWRRRWDSGRWTDWALLPGLLDSIALARDNSGFIHLFGANYLGESFHNVQTSQGSETWNGFNGFGFPGVLRAVAAQTDLDGRIWVFGIDDDRTLRYRWMQSGQWSPWTLFSGMYPSSIAAAVNGLGRIELFCSDQLGKVWRTEQTSRGATTWKPWTSAGEATGGFVTSVAAEQNADGRIDLFALSGNDEVFIQWQNTAGGAWSPWRLLTPKMTPAPVTVPDLRGKTPAAAQQQLDSLFLRLGTATQSPVDEYLDSGKILSHTPTAGAQIALNTPIDYRIGKWNGNRQ